MTLILCDVKELPPQHLRTCQLRHEAAKVRFFRGIEKYDACLYCPKIIDLEEEMARKSRERVTCKVCQTPDSFDFSNGICRKCFFSKKDKAETVATDTASVQPENQSSQIKLCVNGCGKPATKSRDHGLCTGCSIKKAIADKRARETAPALAPETESVPVDPLSKEVLPPGWGNLCKKPLEEEKKLECACLIGALRRSDSPSTQLIRAGVKYHHRCEYFGEEFELFSFCPRCGKRLLLKPATRASDFETIFSEVEP